MNFGFSQATPVYGAAQQEYEQKLTTPSSRCSTLRRDSAKAPTTATLNKSYQQPQLPTYGQQCLIVTSCGVGGGGGGGSISGGGSSASSGSGGSNQQHLPEFLNFERTTLDYRLKNLPPIADQQNNIDYRSLQHRNDQNGSKNDSEFRLSGSDFVTNNIDYSTTTQGGPLVPSSSSTTGKTSRLSRNHIITDTLPGPESCV